MTADNKSQVIACLCISLCISQCMMHVQSTTMVTTTFSGDHILLRGTLLLLVMTPGRSSMHHDHRLMTTDHPDMMCHVVVTINTTIGDDDVDVLSVVLYGVVWCFY